MLKNTLPLKTQNGFTLIEVMISLFILSVGMLGTSAMLLEGQRAAANTNSETLAIEIAGNVMERMRGNVNGVGQGFYNSFTTAGASTYISCISSTGCTPQQVAQFDAYMTYKELESLFPSSASAVVTVTGNATTSSIVDRGSVEVFTLKVNWDETFSTSATTGAVKNKTYTMVFAL